MYLQHRIASYLLISCRCVVFRHDDRVKSFRIFTTRETDTLLRDARTSCYPRRCCSCSSRDTNSLQTLQSGYLNIWVTCTRSRCHFCVCTHFLFVYNGRHHSSEEILHVFLRFATPEALWFSNAEPVGWDDIRQKPQTCLRRMSHLRTM